MAGINELAKHAKVKPEVIKEVVDAIVELVKTGQDVRVAGLGTFSKQHKEARSHVENPLKPGTFYDVAAKDVLKFKAGKDVDVSAPKPVVASNRRR